MATAVTLEHIAELANHLSPQEQMQLVVQIGQKLEHVLAAASTNAGDAGSPAIVLRAMRQPPHLPTGDVDELEKAIAEGRLPVRSQGTFDSGR